VVLAARGKSDWEIARILGLSEATVSTYFKHVRERYHVSTRMQAVLRALYEGAIPFSEIF
jgi:LuxR family transcriptional regulator, quorum-sensing system regulator CciR